MAVGAAMTGLRPIIEGMNMGFCCLPSTKSPTMLRYTSGGNFKIPMVIRGPGVLDVNWVQNTQREAYFQAVPGLKIVACSTFTRFAQSCHPR